MVGLLIGGKFDKGAVFQEFIARIEIGRFEGAMVDDYGVVQQQGLAVQFPL